MKQIENIYSFGHGLVAVGVGEGFKKESNEKIPFISIGKKSDKNEIGSSLMESTTQETELILLTFENIEGFNVFKEMVNKAESLLLAK